MFISLEWDLCYVFIMKYADGTIINVYAFLK